MRFFADFRCCAFLTALVGAALFLNTPAFGNTASEPVPKDADWIKRHEGFVAEAARGNIDVLFLGDSITDMWRREGRAIWEAHFAALHAGNFGIDGDRTQHLLWRIQHGTLDGLSPKVVVLLIGTNNTGMEKQAPVPRNTTTEAIEGIKAVLGAIRAKLPNARILLLGILPRGEPDSPYRSQIGVINAALRDQADDQAIRFLDISSVFLCPDGSISRQIMPDLLHPNEAGYAIWAAALEKPLQEMLGAAPEKSR